MLAQEISNTLKTHGLCANDEDFSYHFLGKSRRYFSAVKSKGMDLPLGSKTILAARLAHVLKCLNEGQSGRQGYAITVANLSCALTLLQDDINKQSLTGFGDNF